MLHYLKYKALLICSIIGVNNVVGMKSSEKRSCSQMMMAFARATLSNIKAPVEAVADNATQQQNARRNSTLIEYKDLGILMQTYDEAYRDAMSDPKAMRDPSRFC